MSRAALHSRQLGRGVHWMPLGFVPHIARLGRKALGSRSVLIIPFVLPLPALASLPLVGTVSPALWHGWYRRWELRHYSMAA